MESERYNGLFCVCYDDYNDAADSDYIGVFDSLREVIEMLG